ncbi:MAG: DsbA family oxidoreductase [Acidimicrobiales bacterium]
MQVEIWSDVVCPWCYVGKRRFEAALSRFAHAGEVEVTWRSFELDPSAPPRRTGTNVAHLAEKYGTTIEQAEAGQRQLTDLAAAEGLEYHLDRTAGGNTFDAHRLLHLAAAVGTQDVLKEALLRACLTDGVPVGEPGALVEVAVAAGMERGAVARVLGSDDLGEEVRADEAEALRLGITGVPYFVIDRAYGISGAQPADLLLEALERAWSDSHPLQVLPGADGAACSGDACTL